MAERPVRICHATRAAPGAPVNEDYVVAGPDWAVVLDGATAPAGVDTGCVHDVAWLVRVLAGELSRLLTGGAGRPGGGSAGSLADVLADAIERVRAAHGGSCDLAGPDGPSSTVALVRRRDAVIECLVLADSPIAVQGRDGTVRVVADDRLDRLPGGRPYSTGLVRAHRNRPGGFWVAGADPAAAYEAVTASFPEPEVAAVAVVTDGVTRLIEHYGRDWPGLLAALRSGGPDQVIAQVREAERARPPAGGKPHDDATALLITFGEGAAGPA